ncbi:MAG: HD domain-containing protein [Acholeplasmatales bacterium]|nr:HD domain-containing protein [Acholeplasmatales bacterium]
MDYKKMLEFVRKTLSDNDAIKSRNVHHQFRDRAKHSYRIYKWVERLSPDFPDADLDVAKTAAIFHDVGYSKGKKDHALYSALIFEKYAKENKFDSDFTNKVLYIIENHSNKELLKTSNNKELILVLEADLLDEEGAMGLMWDLMAAGSKGVEAYEDGMEELYIHSLHILDQDFMVTPIAKKYWNEKKKLVKDYLDQIKEDLFIEEN